MEFTTCKQCEDYYQYQCLKKNGKAIPDNRIVPEWCPLRKPPKKEKDE